MKVKIVSRKLIKPGTPTPQNLRTYKISSMDELNPTMYVIGILYYSSSPNIGHLENSLAQILPQFYPFAGRYIKEDHLVNCSDQGAEFVEAEVDCDLLEITGSGAERGELNDLLPLEVGAADQLTDPILSVQITKFECGGTAIGTCISHRLIDACSLGTFLSAWSKASLGDKGEPIIPNFDFPLYFPAENLGILDFGIERTRDTKHVSKKILFDKKAIATLRDGVSHLFKNNERPASRVLVVTAFLMEALLRSDRAKHGQPRPFIMAQAVNIRERTIPPLSKYSIGNLVSLATLDYSADESKSMDYERFVTLLADSVKKAVSDCTKIFSNREDGHKIMVDFMVSTSEKTLDSSINGIWFTDWSKFSFYEADFGFGKPIWTSTANIPIKNHVTLLNTKENDGIEAWVNLHEEDMVYFERDEEIMKLTT
ncbi:unnamed protein product [Fraxinus pennsylvanica]|uniref:Uncharacterized protein n=1 Tax=Fraxinus pennsylvanica TaxID=56036 RepID=A0AAD1ZWQ3_9LAMI|nr:unnamed protein product [Fraxinus pennsylvanica]